MLAVLGQDLAIMSSDCQLWLYDPVTGLQKSHNRLTSAQELTVTSAVTLAKHENLLIASQERLMYLVNIQI